MAPVTKPKAVRDRTFLREWRLFRQKESENKRDYTLESVAAVIGMSRSNLNKMELGDTPYLQQHMEALAKLYRCSVADLVARDPNDKSSAWAVLDLLEGLPSEQIRIVHGLVESMDREQKNQKLLKTYAAPSS